MLEKTVSVFNSECKKRFHRPPTLTPLRDNMPWTDILAASIDYILTTVNPVIQIMYKPDESAIGDESAILELPVCEYSYCSGYHGFCNTESSAANAIYYPI